MIPCKSTFKLVLIALFLAANAVVHSQNLDRKISISADNKPLGDVITEIGVKGNLLFSYSSQAIPVQKKVSVKAKDEAVRSILDRVLNPLGIQYFLSENQVILKPVRKSVTTASVSEQKPKYTLSGYVKDKATGEILIGANVYDKTSWQGTTTNGYGFYSLTLPEGHYNLAFSLIGYSLVVQQVELKENIKLSATMEVAGIDIKEVEIKGSTDDPGATGGSAGEVRFSSSTLHQMPGFAGNIDVIKSLHSVPGINSFGDGSTFYYVRGGNSDQNLLLIDDAPIYNPSHLFGFFSALAPDAIKDVKAYKGDFPASYGGRLSSVIDVRARDGNMKRLGFSGNIGPFTSDLTLEGPLKKDASSFIISGRRSNLNWLNFSSAANRTFSINFYDLNAKLNIRLNDYNRMFVTGFAGNDDFSRFINSSVQTFGIQWKNSTGTLRWNHIFNNKLFSNTTACFSQYNYYLFMSRQQNDYWNSAISNGTLKTDFSWYPNPENTLKAGIEVSSHFINPGNVHFSDNEIQRFAPVVPQYRSLEYDLYLSNDQKIGDRLSLRYGLRLSAWRDMGASSVYFFDANHKVIDTANIAANAIYAGFFNFEPRLSVSYAVGTLSSFRLSYSRTVQYLQVLSNSTSPFTSLEVWAPSGPNIQPQKADQVTLGYLKRFDHAGIDFTVETFYKRFMHQLEYKDHANMLYNPLIEGELRFGDAWSYGIEVLLKKSEGKFTGWIGYSYARAIRKVEEINSGKSYPASYDRPNTVCLNIFYRTGRHWDFSANWVYLSGTAITTPTGFYRYNGYTVPVYGDKNNDRLPDYHRMDLSVTWLISKPENRFRHSLVLSVYNVYGRKNPFSVNFNKIMDDNGKFYVPTDLDGNYELVSTKMSVAGAIPSLNYTFRF